MSLDQKQAEDQPISNVDELLGYFRSGEKPDGEKLLGLEHEKFVYPLKHPKPLAYDGENGIGSVMAGFAQFGWQEFREAPELPIIAMTRGKAALSLEPGGQFELSGSPFQTAREAHAALAARGAVDDLFDE